MITKKQLKAKREKLKNKVQRRIKTLAIIKNVLLSAYVMVGLYLLTILLFSL